MSAIPSWARVGAKVVCIDNSWAEQLTVDAEYVIGAITDQFLCIDGTYGGGPNGLGEWYPSRFRPLITLEHDIATHFVRLLDVPEGVDA